MANPFPFLFDPSLNQPVFPLFRVSVSFEKVIRSIQESSSAFIHGLFGVACIVCALISPVVGLGQSTFTGIYLTNDQVHLEWVGGNGPWILQESDLATNWSWTQTAVATNLSVDMPFNPTQSKIFRLSEVGGSVVVEDVRQIWNFAPYNAFTGLAWYSNQFFCVFREASAHVSWDGQIRVIRSADGTNWGSAALISGLVTNADLRDPKIMTTPSGQLMAVFAQRTPGNAGPYGDYQSQVTFSSDGTNWSSYTPIGEPAVWLWSVTWNQFTAYSMGYDVSSNRFIRLFSSPDGRTFTQITPDLFTQYPSETRLLFRPDQSCVALVRRDLGPATDLLGLSQPPYTNWTFQALDVHIASPALQLLPDGRILASGRLYHPNGTLTTSLLWLLPDAAQIVDACDFPVSADTGYPAIVYRDGKAWITYYAGDGTTAAIYIARVHFP
jgi:hypothetical protein